MTKPTVYLDTSIISAYWYSGTDAAMNVRRAQTRAWWESERSNFDVRTSAVVAAELSAGSFPRQLECIKMARRHRFLEPARRARKLQTHLIDLNVVPPGKRGDAAHLALCCVHNLDYLLTWNYAHMANPVVQARLGELCQRLDLRPPLMVSPEMIPHVRLGQTIRRKE